MNQQLRPCKFIASLQPSASHRSPPHSGAISGRFIPIVTCSLVLSKLPSGKYSKTLGSQIAWMLCFTLSRSETGFETAIWRSKFLLIGRERDQHYPSAHGLKWRWYGTHWCDFPSSCRSYGYGSIPINTIFSGMNIHLPAILMFTRGTRFWHTAILPYRGRSSLWGHGKQANAQAFDSKYKRFARLMCPEFIWNTYFLFVKGTHRPTILLNRSLLFNFPTSFGTFRHNNIQKMLLRLSGMC